MKIKIEKLCSCTKEELYNIVKPFVSKVLNNYAYTITNKDDISELINLSVENIINNKKSDETILFDEQFTNNFEEQLIIYLSNKLNTCSKFYSFMSNYIDNKVTKTITYNNSKEYFLDIVLTLLKLEYPLTPEECIELITRNTKLNNIIE